MGIVRGGRPLGKVSLPAPLPSKPGSGATFRIARQADVAALVELRLDFMRIVKNSGLGDEGSWRDELAALFERELRSGFLLVWVAEAEGRVVASSGLRLPPRVPRSRLGPSASPRGEGEILNMYTFPGFRRRGIGSRLLGLAVAEARSRGLGRLRLQPTDDGRPLYARAGFRDRGRSMVLELGDER